ncbi:MAG: acyl-CoA reductase [Flavobacteriaceae bacterium]
MTQHRSILEAFVKLGVFLCDFVDWQKQGVKTEDIHFISLQEAITLAGHHNGWFTEENIVFALKNWALLLTEEKLNQWLCTYALQNNKPKTVAIIMAGNIPLVGFHDFLATLITGNSVLVKLSSNDRVLLPVVAKILLKLGPCLIGKITFTEEKLENFDAVIATGSNNTARYFEYYFGKYPHIIRKNRNSVALLTGNESAEQLIALGEDIFRYYGLGCRSVSKLFVPYGYDFDVFFKAMYTYGPIINQTKYANNYDYNKAVYLMSGFKILDNGFLMLKEDNSYSSPIASLFYERYTAVDEVKEKLKYDADYVQCIVSYGVFEDEIPFGETQKPALADYADQIDTVEFLLKT